MPTGFALPGYARRAKAGDEEAAKELKPLQETPMVQIIKEDLSEEVVYQQVKDISGATFERKKVAIAVKPSEDIAKAFRSIKWANGRAGLFFPPVRPMPQAPFDRFFHLDDQENGDPGGNAPSPFK